MSTQTKIKLNLVNLSDFLPGYDVANFESTMSGEEARHWSDLAVQLRKQGKRGESSEAMGKIPLEPGLALTQYVMLGREGLLLSDFNLKDAEKAYGADWLDRFEVGTGCLRLKKASNG